MTTATGPPPADVLGLAGRVAVVTGGASGIGAACVDALARAGAAVAVLDVDGPGARVVADAATRDHGVPAAAVVADVTDAAAVDAATASVVARLGTPDVWVNNAGGLAGREPAAVLDADPDDWDAVVALNLRGTFLGARAAARAARDRPGGRVPGAIVNVASLQGLRAAPHLAAYGAAKAGVLHLTTTLALELAPLGIRVNAVAPSFVDTPASRARVSPERRRDSEAAIPLGRIGRPADVAGLVVVLASPLLSAFVTGQVLVADGGLSLTTARPTRDRAGGS